eukprot:gnl/MRDRNA2_/MRDRNA2_85217_c0_seq1.p1 gnl/MRDRNA2_/MRDRNA2_85217_c0~~gnl/MRDRNA2_/MRDRNA2_85217_c0_seq1.p1  ORF type:complete len:588 (-),score=119.73 gnl/MRDRNA2_/MRDRNA2_85217_c0_seq1:336-2099(-)
MHVSVWVFALIGSVYAEVQVYAPEIEASLAEVDVDANANVQLNENPMDKAVEKLTKGGAKLMMLSIFDKDGNQCVDQAEFANAMILNPLIGVGKGEGPGSWALAVLQQGRIDPKTVLPYKWCPNKKIQATAAGEEDEIEELDDEEEFDNPHVSKNVSWGYGKKCPSTKTRESHFAKESCMAFVKEVLYKTMGKLAKPLVTQIGDMCRVLFPGPCVMGPKQVKNLMTVAFSSMEAVSSSGWLSQELMEDNFEEWNASVVNGIYQPSTFPASPEQAYKHPDLHCGTKWGGQYWEKNVTIPGIKPKDFIPGTDNYSPVTMARWLYAFLGSLDPGDLAQMFKAKDELVEVAVYEAANATNSSNGICVVTWQETQVKKKRGTTDRDANYAADLVKFGMGVKGRAHRGLLKAYTTLMGLVKAKIESSSCSDPTMVKKIIFTGYSAGGGMAAMNFVHAKASWANFATLGQTAYLITAGAPPVGDLEFCESNFNDGKTYQVASFKDAIVTGTLAGDLGVLVAGMLGIHHCSKLHWISCQQNTSLPADYPVKDCHSQDGVYSQWAINQGDDEFCPNLVGEGPPMPASDTVVPVDDR